MATNRKDNGDRFPGRAPGEGPSPTVGVRDPAAAAGRAAPPEVGAARVAAVREALAAGTYRVNHRRVAERMVKVEDLSQA